MSTSDADHKTPGDAQLVAETLTGHTHMFDTLVERYQKQATSVAYRLLGNLHDALEVSQEAFVRAYRHLESLQTPERFGPWLLRIVTNLSLNYRRSRATRPAISLEDCIIHDDQSSGELIAAPQHTDVYPDQQAQASELEKIIQEKIADLPDQQRLAIVLFSVEKLPQKEVAQIMECSVEAVKWHVFQARKKLKESLAEHIA